MAGRVVRDALAGALSLVLPVSCAGCGAFDRAVCPACARELEPAPRLVAREPLGTRAVWAGLRYRGAVRPVLRAYKDAGRTDAAAALAPALGAAIETALRALPQGGPDALELCTIPSTPAALRARGYRPVERLLTGLGLRAARVLRPVAGHLDQAGLDAEARRRNSSGWLRAHRAHGRRFLLVDDVLTTGSTLAAAAAAIESGGGRVLGFAVLAETPRRADEHRRRSSGNSP
ncbi:ComF family protein [Agromyces soli]|uniref:ComF family protein n=1 Tax=Agromyces soli TaxID=659012 RepID=A0ABY4AS79_9MICO|nr:phosphoribosyltransferase family protein [Agromyces soli]UOE25988.1 ComF family protein [Agromyces soli]